MKYLSLPANNKNTDKLHIFDKNIKDGNDVFVMFHMKGCVHCNSALPEWKNIKNRIHNKLKNNNNIVIADIESSNLFEIKNASNILGFPTIRYIHNYGNSYEDYNGPRVVSEFIKWIESKISNNPSPEIYKGGKRNKTKKNKTKKRLLKEDDDDDKVDFDFDLFIKKLFTFKM